MRKDANNARHCEKARNSKGGGLAEAIAASLQGLEESADHQVNWSSDHALPSTTFTSSSVKPYSSYTSASICLSVPQREFN